MADTNRDPSPEEIRRRCEEIQSTWTPSERMRRMSPALRPLVRFADGSSEEMDADDFETHSAKGEI